MYAVNILSSQKYQYLADNIISCGNDKNSFFDKCDIETKIFPDGEVYNRLIDCDKIHNKPAVYICGTVDDAAILEAYNICCTLVRERCLSLHLVIPYFGYSTMERSVLSGEVVTAKNLARLFSSIPLSSQGNYIYMIDLHSLGTQYYFEHSVHTVHLTADEIIYKMLENIGQNVVLASADMGRAKRIEKMSQKNNLESAYIMKKRISGEKTEVVSLNANVEGKAVAIYDDMIRSGSSIINAALAYKNAGAKDIYVLTTHGVFIPGSIEKLKNSGLIRQILCTNSHCNIMATKDNFIKVYDIAPTIISGLEL